MALNQSLANSPERGAVTKPRWRWGVGQTVLFVVITSAILWSLIFAFLGFL